jgi:septal ring factor EnvC (AmiA/AmiB activator)
VAAIPLAFLVAALVTWAACRWWYGKKLMAAAYRLQKSDKSRLFSQEQTQQARRQIEQLKGELAAQQQSAAEFQAARRRAQAEEALRASESLAEPDPGRLPVVSAHGFADTQVLPD